jgi:primosomal protein N' (replication factor Y)
LIQTYLPENEIVKTITEKNYKEFFVSTLNERKMFHYPPFMEMATLEYRHKSEQKALNFIQKLEEKLK